MRLLLVASDHPVLRAKAPTIPNPDAVKELVADLHQTMVAEGGVGLAAPQVGKSLRLFVSGVERPLTFINPELKRVSGEEVWREEGCLSLPRLLGQVKRPKEVTVAATGADGRRFEVNADGLLARVIQHEIDHLDGLLFTDRMDDLSSLTRISETEWESRHHANRAQQDTSASELV